MVNPSEGPRCRLKIIVFVLDFDDLMRSLFFEKKIYFRGDRVGGGRVGHFRLALGASLVHLDVDLAYALTSQTRRSESANIGPAERAQERT